MSFSTPAPDLHLQHVARMTQLTSLNLHYAEAMDEMPSGLQLTMLPSLVCLHSLALCELDFQGSSVGFECLRSLRKLSLIMCHTDSCDMASCMQVTSLSLTWSFHLPKHVLPPTGSNVQLHQLSVCTVGDWAVSKDHELRILQDASQITSMELKDKPISLGEQGWPVCLPNLKAIKVDTMPAATSAADKIQQFAPS